MSRVLPILFNTEMVKAILDGRKTVTRRICKDGNDYVVPDMDFYDADKRTYAVHSFADKEHTEKLSLAERTCPICLGDILYVRETWSTHYTANSDGKLVYCYKADGINLKAECLPGETNRWYPSIHMPKEAARIWLGVADVRVERLQDESMADDGKLGIIKQFLENKNRTCVLEIWKEALERTDMPQKWQSSEIMDMVASIPGWERMKNSTTFGKYGTQKGLRKKQPTTLNQSTNCQPSTTNSLKNGENLEDSCQNSADGFISLEDFEQEELPFQ